MVELGVPVDVPVLLGDNSRLVETTGWSADHDLDQTLAELTPILAKERSLRITHIDGAVARRSELRLRFIALDFRIEQDSLVLEQYRHAAQRRFVELPAGLCDVAGEDPLTTAKRELLEEAELRAATWEHLITTYPSPGISSERMEIFLARDLAPADRGEFEPSHEEADMTSRWVPLDELVGAVLESRVTDAPLALAVLAYAHRRERAKGRPEHA